MNTIAGASFVDLGVLLAEIHDWRTYWWLYAMAFSTVVPTALHFGIATFSLQALWPLRWRHGLRAMIDRREVDFLAATLAPLALGAIWAKSTLGPPFLLGWAAYHFGGDALKVAGAAYVDWLLTVALWAEAL